MGREKFPLPSNRIISKFRKRDKNLFVEKMKSKSMKEIKISQSVASLLGNLENRDPISVKRRKEPEVDIEDVRKSMKCKWRGSW